MRIFPALIVSTIVALAMLAGVHQFADAQSSPGAEQFTLDTDELRIIVEGDGQAIRDNAAAIVMRIDAVEPELIRPGIAVWVEPVDDQPYLPGKPKLKHVGRIVSVEPRPLNY